MMVCVMNRLSGTESMITFFISVAILLLGYRFYSRFVERVFGIDPQKATPAISMADGVDYVPLPKWKIFLIQFLNIAGLGPIFGAVAGAMWGPVAFPFSSYFSLYIAIGANAQRNPKKKTRKDRATLSTNLHLAHPGPCH
ncbi:MAG TPA: carbon starvation CstA family protein [Anseongella sp.]